MISVLDAFFALKEDGFRETGSFIFSEQAEQNWPKECLEERVKERVKRSVDEL